VKDEYLSLLPFTNRGAYNAFDSKRGTVECHRLSEVFILAPRRVVLPFLTPVLFQPLDQATPQASRLALSLAPHPAQSRTLSRAPVPALRRASHRVRLLQFLPVACPAGRLAPLRLRFPPVIRRLVRLRIRLLLHRSLRPLSHRRLLRRPLHRLSLRQVLHLRLRLVLLLLFNPRLPPPHPLRHRPLFRQLSRLRLRPRHRLPVYWV
jgi:hypothetical protein